MLSREQSSGVGDGIIIAHSQHLSYSLMLEETLSIAYLFMEVFFFNWSALSKASPWHFHLPHVWRRYLKTDCEKLKP